MIEQILQPVSRTEFLRDYWTRQFLHIPGHADKFSHFFPWDVLNRSLEQHRFDARRLGLLKSGKRIEPSRYLNGASVNSAG
jgi:hypothetical protein